MIILNDCKAFCDADPATVARTARQQNLPEVLAIARAHGLVQAASTIDVRPAAIYPRRSCGAALGNLRSRRS
jgi:hypothetical protein